jgi:RNA polymerase sigma-70 factor, ECF subfamily
VNQQLVERARAGDRDAYEQLARGSADRLYAVAYQITRDADRADDAVQQALVAMWRDLPSLRDASRFESWTFRLVTRASLQDLRQRRRVNVLPLSDETESRGPRDMAADLAVRDQLERAIGDLTPNHRAVVVLRYVAALQIDEIAEVLGVPRGTVASRLHHATNALRAAIDADERPTAEGGQPA